MPDASGKICIRCGEDCSNKQRSKNAEGNYICADCLAKIKARQPAPPPLPGTKPVAGPGPAVAQPRSAARGGEDQGVLGKLIDESVEMHKHGCPNCHAPMKPTQILCVKCGFNKERGKQLQTVVKKAAQQPDVELPSRYAKSRRLSKMMEIGGASIGVIALLSILALGGLFAMAAMNDDETWTLAFFAVQGIYALVAGIIILVCMFMDEVWKGFVGLICGLYMIYWVVAESDSKFMQTLLGVSILSNIGVYFLIGKAASLQ